MAEQKLDTFSCGSNVYGQNQSLLFQFILSEFLNVYDMIGDIEHVYAATEALLIEKRLHEDVSSQLKELQSHLVSITGNQMHASYGLSFQWESNPGSLNKLRHYAYCLSVKRADDSEAVKMNVCVSKAFHSALQLKEVVSTLLHHLAERELPNYVTFYQLIDKLIDNMRSTSRILLKLLLNSKDDEKIVYFLLSHQKRFEKVYNSELVFKLLKKMFPQGMKHAKDSVIEKFARRGFTSLVHIIGEQMAVLETKESVEL